jgi:hypothetical protein
MLKSMASKVMWMGRATVFLVGLAVTMALVFGVASTALGANGDFLKVGSAKNIATRATTLVGKATGSALVVKNPTGGSALGLQVDAGQAPLTVDADAGTATNLDADELDGQDSSEFLGKMQKAADSETLDGMDSTHFVRGLSGTVQVDPPSVEPGSCAVAGIQVQGVNAGDVASLSPTMNFTFSESLTVTAIRDVNSGNNNISYQVCNVGDNTVDAPAGYWGFLVARFSPYEN